VVCTPHVELVDVRSLPERVQALQAALREADIPLEIRVGGEIRAGTPLVETELQILAHGPPGHRWVLLEAPLEPGNLDMFHAHADELEDRGYGLLIAHPERCEALVAPGGGLDHRLREGARLQVNASSLTGAHGPQSRRAGFDLVERGLVAALASDAHGEHRPPLLSAALRELSARGHADDRLVAGGPRRLLRHGIGAAGHRSVA
jgi:protein-tyrosine phosphatase